MSDPVIQHDTLDDRREVYRQLKALPPARRLGFLRWCAARARLPRTNAAAHVSRATHERARQARWDTAADEKLTIEIFFDLFTLACQYEFDLGGALRELERRARGGR